MLVREWEDGRVEIHCAGRTLPFSIFDQHPHVAHGAIVENKRLGAVLAVIQAAQDERDRTRLASKKLTLRQKERILAARQPPDAVPSNRTFLLGVDIRQCPIENLLVIPPSSDRPRVAPFHGAFVLTVTPPP